MATDYAEITDSEEPAEEGGGFTLADLAEADNAALLLSDDRLALIGQRVVREYEIDVRSRKAWYESHKEGLKLAMQVMESKTYPFPKAANVKFPLLTTAAMQFAARAYPAIVPGDQLVKAKVNGEDADGSKRKRADRVAEHLSWQLTEEMEEWEEDTDKLLHILPIAGICYRKTYFDPSSGRNRSEMVMPDKLVVNDGARDLASVPRVTQELEYYPQEVMERVRQGLWIECDLGAAKDDPEDEQAPHDFLEQHRLIDLDGDGFMEPWIVTVHKEKAKVVRIVANFDMDELAVNEQGEIAEIPKRDYYTKYPFLPNPSGGFHTIGFGYLLRPLNEAINTTVNQLLDAGHLQNVGGGFIGSGARITAGRVKRRIGEWIPVEVPGAKLRENMVTIDHPGPSPVLFNLLGLLLDAARDITSVKDVMTGEAQGRNQSPTTTLALIEQGMQVFSAIYKRIFRSLKQEYRKLYRLNARYLDEQQYFTLHDSPSAVARADYAEGDLDIVPVADPTTVTNMQKLGRAQFLMEFRDDPNFNPQEIRRRMLEAAGIDDIDEVLLEQTPLNPEVAKWADEIELKKRDQLHKEIELLSEMEERYARGLKLIAEAEAAEAGPQLQQYQQVLDALKIRSQLIIAEGQRRQQAAQKPNGGA